MRIFHRKIIIFFRHSDGTEFTAVCGSREQQTLWRAVGGKFSQLTNESPSLFIIRKVIHYNFSKLRACVCETYSPFVQYNKDESQHAVRV